MSDNQKYYYLKLKEDFFESDEVLFLESMPEGYKYSNILLKLYLRSLKNNGKLMMNNLIPYNAEMLAIITRHSVGDIKQAIQIFSQLGLVEQLDNGAIYMLQIQNFIGKSSTEGDRKRAYRRQIELEKQKALKVEGQKSGHLSDKQAPEIEIEIDKEIDIYNKDISDKFISYLNQIILSYKLTDAERNTILKATKDIDNKEEYLKRSIAYMEEQGKDVKTDFGYLVKMLKEQWDLTKIPAKKTTAYKKTAFHNFDNSNSEQYSEENLKRLMERGR